MTPNGLATNAWFEWGTDAGLSGYSTTASQPVGSGTISQLVTAPLTGLSPGVPCYYRVAASNGTGVSRGAIVGFSPGAAPWYHVGGHVGFQHKCGSERQRDPERIVNSARFEWGTDPNLGTPSLTPLQTGLSGTSTSVDYQTAYRSCCGANSITTGLWPPIRQDPRGAGSGLSSLCRSFRNSSTISASIQRSEPITLLRPIRMQ